MTNLPRIGFGEVRHRRLAPVEHAFVYPTCFVLLPMRALRAGAHAALARNRRALFGFRDTDHGDGRTDSLAWFDTLLAREGVRNATGEVWLHCIPRMYGFAFKPVSFWYAHRADGSLAAILVEVNNTFGERHCYLLDGDELAFGRTLRARKVFHVSPFCETRGEYAFRFMRTDLERADARGRTAVRVELQVDGAPLMVTSVSGAVEPLTGRSVRHALLAFPAMTLLVVARIHWQALKIWARRVPLVRKPAPPTRPLTRAGAAAPAPASAPRPPGSTSSTRNPA